MRAALILLVLAFVCVVSAQPDPCLRHKDCYSCQYNNELCGWCGGNGLCLTGSSSGPDDSRACYNASNTDQISDRWEFTWSFIMNQTDNDPRISPDTINIFLRPGVPVTFPVTLRVPITPPIDLFQIQDVSFSMASSVTTVRDLLQPIINGLLSFTNGTECGGPCVVFGLASYIEKPVMPYANWPEAYVYRLEKPLDDDTVEMTAALNRILDSLRRNFEHPEDALEALMFAVQDPNVGWRQGSFKIPLINTDASAHEAGSGAHLGIFHPNNGDGIADGVPPGSGEDYPTLEQVRLVAIRMDATPMFAATPNVFQYYQNIVNRWNFGAAIEVDPTGSDIVEKIVAGAREALSKAVLATLDDDKLRIVSVEPNDGITLNSGVYTNVTAGSEIVFNVTVEASLLATEDFGTQGYATLRYVGFGNQIVVHTHMGIECIGCADEHPEYQIDLCGVCGGDSTLCIGCDGILGSGRTFDACGVCGGQGLTCADCFGVPNGGATVDVCGECGGDGQMCLGCDNIPNSGIVENECGVCGGGPNCEALGAAVAALIGVATAGIVIAALALLFLIGAGAVMARADAALFEEEATLQDNPLYEEAKRKFDNPLFKDQ